MAFDFLGTFNAAMYERLLTFIQSQAPFIEARITHLEAEVSRVGLVVFRYNQGIPIGYAGDPTDSYLGKLLSAYEVLGGNPFVDLRVRLSTDPVFVLPGDETTGPHTMSNGEVIGAKGLNDANSAELIRSLRSPFDLTINRRFDALERKIRRAMDYVDQLQAEITELQTILQIEADLSGSLANLDTQITQLLTDSTYRAITPDKSETAKFGLDVYAPFSSYDVPQGAGPDPNQVVPREATTPQRQSGDTAPVKPGQRSV